MKEYKITQEQFEDIQHYKRMFQVNAEYIQGLCSSEKSDIIYGFELGKMYSRLIDSFTGMMNLESEILNQKIDANI